MEISSYIFLIHGRAPYSEIRHPYNNWKEKEFHSFLCKNIWEHLHSSPWLDLRIGVEDFSVESLTNKLDVSLGQHEPNLDGYTTYGEQFKSLMIKENLWFNFLFLFYVIM